jgi:ubiquitin C-terminal hydrolase
MFTQEETLDGDEKAFCERCKTKRKSTKRFSIKKFPDVLVIHLKRFTTDDRGKLRTSVKFPLAGFDMGAYAEVPVRSCSYNLYGISNHFGTAFSGHYIGYCKHPFSREWHCYDDSR